MKLQVIIGSTRTTRVSDRLAEWVALEAKTIEDVEVEIVDLANYKLPMFDEPGVPAFNPDRKPVPEVARLLAKLDEGDAYVIVTPEYNRSYPATLKNALDYIDHQFKHKPVALVAHGSSGGAQAISHLRGVIPGVQSITTPAAVYFTGRVGELISSDGVLNDELKANPHGPQFALKRALDELKWYSDALSLARK